MKILEFYPDVPQYKMNFETITFIIVEPMSSLK